MESKERGVKILLVEDNAADAYLIREMLINVRDFSFELDRVDRLADGLARVKANTPDVVLLDLLLPDSHDLGTFAAMYAQAPHVPIIVLSTLGDQALGAQAVREGAQDYLVKGQVDGFLLVRAIRYAVERKQVEQALRRRNEDLARLNRAVRALSASLDLDQVLATVLEEACRLLGAAAPSLAALAWLNDPETGGLICRRAVGSLSDAVWGWRLTPGEGLAGWAARSGESLMVADLLADERHSVRLAQELNLPSCAALEVPLRVKHGVVGVLEVLGVGPFAAADLELLELLAAGAAIAVENAQLYAEADRLRVFNANIVQSLEEGILLEDAAGRIVFVNPKTAELLGYAPEELVGRHWADIVASGPRAEIEERDAGRNGGVAIRYEALLATKDGRQVPVIVSARWLYEQARLVGVLSAFTDITARRRAEEALRHSEEKIRQRNEELTALNAIAAAVSQTLDLREMLGAALDETLLALGAEGGIVHLCEEADQTFSPVVQRGLSPALLEQMAGFKLGEGFLGRAAQDGQPIFVPDIAGDGRSIAPAAVAEGWRALVSVPLPVGGEVVGVMTVFGRRAGQFAPERLSMLMAIGNQVGVAIENARLFAAVRVGREQLQVLSHRLVEVQENERRYIARELHDEIGQALTGLKLVLDVAARAPEGGAPDALREALALVEDLLARVRDLSLDLRPTMLDDLGLLPALLWHCGRYTDQTGVRVDLRHTDLEGRRFAPEVETAAYRIVQEALTNVARHAGVDAVTVRLWVEQGTLGVQVEDRGVGFDPDDPLIADISSGLVGMRERAALLGGTLTVESLPGTGTCLTAELPLGSDPAGEGRRA